MSQYHPDTSAFLDQQGRFAQQRGDTVTAQAFVNARLEYDRLNAQALELCAELSGLRRENERLRGELLLITQLQAGDGSTVNGLTKDQLGRAFRQAQDIARAALGIVTHGDSISGSVNPDQPPTVLTNPWNGEPRDIRDVESDPTGILMVEPGKPLRAADQPNVAPSIEWRLTTEKINDLQIDSIKRLIPLCKAAHFVNVRVRINGTWEEYQADWIKHMVRIERAADPTTEVQK